MGIIKSILGPHCTLCGCKIEGTTLFSDQCTSCTISIALSRALLTATVGFVGYKVCRKLMSSPSKKSSYIPSDDSDICTETYEQQSSWKELAGRIVPYDYIIAASSDERCVQCDRRAVNNLEITDQVCEVCRSISSRRHQLESTRQVRPRFGEYSCSCGRFWSSRLSRDNCYQICKRCRRQVYPSNLRDLCSSDISDSTKNVQEHQKELCQMCQQLGQYCGNFGRSRNNHNNYTRQPKLY